MLLYIASVIIFFFIAFNLFFHCNCPLAVKVAGCLLLLLASLKYEVYQFLGGAFFAPQLPRAVLIFFEALYGAFIILFFILLLWDLYLTGNWLLSRIGVPTPAALPAGKIRVGLVALALALGTWGTWKAIKVPVPKEITLTISGLPAELKGTRLVQLTDLHIGPILKKDWLAAVVELVNSQNPDLILMTGDYIDGYAKDLASELAPLAELKAKYGVFAVTGNHEYYWNMPEWREVLERMNIRMLENRHVDIAINGQTR